MIFGHVRMRKIISSYLDGEASPRERELLQAHLETCPACRAYLKRLQKLSDCLRSWKDEELTADLEQKLTNDLYGKHHNREIAAMRKKTVAISIGSSLATVVLVAFFIGHFAKQGVQVALQPPSGVVPTAAPSPALLPAPSAAPVQSPWVMQKSVAALRGFTAQDKSVATDSLGSYSRSLNSASNMQVSYGVTAGCMRAESAAQYEPYAGNTCGIDLRASVQGDFNTENYDRIYDNEFLTAVSNPLSTFSIDVDTASYANIRRFLGANTLPVKDAVRIEEMINYFTYDYPQPEKGEPFSITTELSGCPWKPEHRLVLIGLQGKQLEANKAPASNLVFLLDVSGSMAEPNKLPLVQSAFRLLAGQLRAEDRVSIVTYAGSAGVALDSCPGSETDRIINAIESLRAGGSTAGAQGIVTAYGIAKKNFIKNGNNRVILATDGDFNIGVSSDSELTRMIEERRDDGIFLTVLGFGTGNYKDSRMEKLADKGNGNFAYVDNLMEAKKVFVTGLTGTLFTIAKDVKIQVEFNPSKVKAYRLIGYENRMLKKEDFNDDKKDAGEMGAGHRVTALYEIVPADSKEEFGSVDQLKYQTTAVSGSRELLTVKLRYKEPDGDQSKLITRQLEAAEKEASENLRFATAVAEFGMLLRDSKYKGSSNFSDVIARAKQAKGRDDDGCRAEFIRLVEQAELLSMK